MTNLDYIKNSDNLDLCKTKGPIKNQLNWSKKQLNWLDTSQKKHKWSINRWENVQQFWTLEICPIPNNSEILPYSSKNGRYQRLKGTSVSKLMGGKKAFCIAGGIKISIATLEISVYTPQKARSRISIWPTYSSFEYLKERVKGIVLQRYTNTCVYSNS